MFFKEWYYTPLLLKIFLNFLRTLLTMNYKGLVPLVWLMYLNQVNEHVGKKTTSGHLTSTSSINNTWSEAKLAFVNLPPNVSTVKQCWLHHVAILPVCDGRSKPGNISYESLSHGMVDPLTLSIITQAFGIQNKPQNLIHSCCSHRSLVGSVLFY